MHITLLETDNIPVAPRAWTAPGVGYKANSNLSKEMLSGALTLWKTQAGRTAGMLGRPRAAALTQKRNSSSMDIS